MGVREPAQRLLCGPSHVPDFEAGTVGPERRHARQSACPGNCSQGPSPMRDVVPNVRGLAQDWVSLFGCPRAGAGA